MKMETDRIEKKVLLRAVRARVWRALTDAEEFGTWFGMKLESGFSPGAHVRGTIAPTQVDAAVAEMQKPYTGVRVDLTIERMEPERLFSFRWHPGAVEPGVDYAAEPTTLVVFELEDAAGGTLLTLVESGFENIPLSRRAKVFAGNEQGWSEQMRLIEKYVGKPS